MDGAKTPAGAEAQAGAAMKLNTYSVETTPFTTISASALRYAMEIIELR